MEFESGETSQATISPEEASQKLQDFDAALDDLSGPSSTFPHQEIRQFINEIIPTSGIDVALEASNLFLKLVRKVSVGYDELTFSSCLHHVGKFLKDTLSKTCSKGCSRKTYLCTKSEHIKLNTYVSFWVALVRMIEEKFFSLQNEGLVSILVDALGNIIRHSSAARLLELALQGVRALSAQPCISTTAQLVFKVAFPIALLNLPAANRATLVDSLLCVASPESSPSNKTPCRQIPQRRASQYAGTPCTPTGETTRTPLSPIHSDRRNSEVSEKHAPILNFIKLCTLHVAEKADERVSMTTLLHDVLKELDVSVMSSYIAILKRCFSHPKVAVRLLSVELAARLLGSSNDCLLTPQLRSILRQGITERSKDRQSSVRSKAISSLRVVLQDANGDKVCQISQTELLQYAALACDHFQDGKSRVRKASVDFLGWTCIAFLRLSGDSPAIPLAPGAANAPGPVIDAQAILSKAVKLKSRCKDAVAIVRHSAILAMSNIMKVLVEVGCTEVSSFFNFYIEIVLPLVDDTDARCAEAALKGFESFLLQSNGVNIRRGDSNSRSVGVGPLGSFLRWLGTIREDTRRHAHRAIASLATQGKFDESCVKYFAETALHSSAENEGGSEISQSAWYVLAAACCGDAVAQVKRTLGHDNIMNEIRRGQNSPAFKIALSYINTLKEERQLEVGNEIQDLLFKEVQGVKDLDVLPDAAKLLAAVRSDLGPQLLGKCDQMLGMDHNLAEEDALRMLHLIGSICVSFPLDEKPSESLLAFVQASTSTEQPSSRVRAMGLATLGKLCLCEGTTSQQTSSGSNKYIRGKDIGEKLTRRFVSVFVHELDNATSSATRNNAVLVLCDLCRQYTSVVEPFMSRIAGLLSDPSEFVRVQVSSSITCLLQEDYIKMRSSFVFFQLALATVDASQAVRGTAEHAILHVIPQKNKNLLSVSFVEVMFVLNECSECPAHSQTLVVGGSINEKQFLADDHVRRHTIYDIFLKGMTLEQKLRISGRIRSDIFAHVIEERILLSSNGVSSVLEDALKLVASDKLTTLFRGLRADEDQDEPPGSHGTQNESEVLAKKRSGALKALQVTELREATIPILLELRQTLQKVRSPLLRQVMMSICQLLHPYRAELSSFVRDPTAKSEIEHELSAIEQQKAALRSARDKSKAVHNYQQVSGENENDDGSSANLRTPQAKGGGKRIGLELSVPRTRQKRRRRDGTRNSNSQDDDSVLSKQQPARSSRLRRLSQSPGLIRQMGSATPHASTREAGRNNGSSFAAALQRIENETVSDV